MRLEESKCVTMVGAARTEASGTERKSPFNVSKASGFFQLITSVLLVSIAE